MQRIRSDRDALRQATRERARPVSLFAIVDGDRIPPRCYGEPLCVAATAPRWARAYAALCKTLCRNRQVGITAVDLDGVTRVAALVPIGGMLAVSPLRPEYADAFTDGLRDGRSARARRSDHRRTAERQAAA